MSAAASKFSNKVPIQFGKVGRPANDPIRERLRIYRAAGPLILENGVQRTTMKAVARAAYLEESAGAIRRTIIGLAIDETVTPLRRDASCSGYSDG